VDQVAFRVGSWSVHWYGILVATGFLAGLWTASRRGLRDGLPGELIADLGVWLMIGGIVGARVHHVVAYWQEEFAGQPWWEIFAIHHGGLVFYGGLLGASLATVFYARAKRLPLWRLADALAPSIPLGQAFGRLGCVFNGCCYGWPTGLPWAIRYPADHVTHGAGVHPTPLYEALANLVLYGALAWLYRRRQHPGQVFVLYLLSYGGLRFAVEFFRGDYSARYLGGWATPGQLVSLLVVGVGLWLRWRLRPARASDAT